MTVILKCECDHTRKEHLGGIDYHNDKKVLKCLYENCTCKHYTPDEPTRKLNNDLWLSALAKPVIMGVFILIAGIGLFYFMGYLVSLYDIQYKDEPALFYSNGTEANHHTMTAQESLSENASFIAVIAFGYLGFIVLAIYAASAHENRIKELIKDQ